MHLDAKRETAAVVRLLEKAEVVYFTTIARDGYPRTRALFNLRNRGQFPDQAHLFEAHGTDLMLLFSTNTASTKLNEVRANPRVAVYACAPGDFHGAMLRGDTEILDDLALREALWNDGWERYYPSGPHDPDYTVLRLFPRFIEGWHEGAKFEFELDVI